MLFLYLKANAKDWWKIKKHSEVVYFMFIPYLKSTRSSLQQSYCTYSLCMFSHSPKTRYNLGDSPQAFSITAIPYLHLIAPLIELIAIISRYFFIFPTSFLPTHLHFSSFWLDLPYKAWMWCCSWAWLTLPSGLLALSSSAPKPHSCFIHILQHKLLSLCWIIPLW